MLQLPTVLTLLSWSKIITIVKNSFAQKETEEQLHSYTIEKYLWLWILENALCKRKCLLNLTSCLDIVEFLCLH